jgi:hypothetical protein
MAAAPWRRQGRDPDGADMALTATRAAPIPDRWSIADLLRQGGDERLHPDPHTGRNRYGCGAAPEPAAAAFASTTASTISASAYASVSAHFESLPTGLPAQALYRAEAQATREDLARLCGLPADAADNIVLAPSGTDLHLFAADLAGGARAQPLMTVMPDAGETGRGVPDAVRGRRFASGAAHASAALIGEPLPGAVAGEARAIALRDALGRPRPPGEVDADFERACDAAVRSGRPVLLVLVDVSKSGLIAPSPACAAGLKQRHGEALTVLVDACQFRLSPASLARYLGEGFLVAITGSKFIAGPPFSGALVVPEAAAPRLKARPLLPALGDYSGREDWPRGFVGRAALPDLPNFGMLLRWRAALHEMAAFRALASADVAGFLRTFAGRVEGRIDAIGAFERVAATPLARFGDDAPPDWDTVPTIFGFRVADARGPLDAQRLQALHQDLRNPAAGGLAVHLGQPIGLGTGDGGPPPAALRISASAPLIVEALSAGDGGEAVIARALLALDRTAGRLA